MLAKITSVREALKEARSLKRISLAVSAAMIAETFEMNLVSAILGEAGMDTDLMNAEFIDKGWNPYLWQGSFIGTARYFLDHQMERSYSPSGHWWTSPDSFQWKARNSNAGPG